jgi:hypothetical protein
MLSQDSKRPLKFPAERPCSSVIAAVFPKPSVSTKQASPMPATSRFESGDDLANMLRYLRQSKLPLGTRDQRVRKLPKDRIVNEQD